MESTNTPTINTTTQLIRVKLPSDSWRPIYERVQIHLNLNATKVIEMIARDQLQHIIENIQNVDYIGVYLCPPDRIAAKLLNLDLQIKEEMKKIADEWSPDQFKITDVIVSNGEIIVKLELPNGVIVNMSDSTCGWYDDLYFVRKEDLPVFNLIKHEYAEILLELLPDAIIDALKYVRNKEIDELDDELRKQRSDFERQLEELKEENEKLKEKAAKLDEIIKMVKEMEMLNSLEQVQDP